ncbi:hypothetical protein DPMN_156348 [Dreissena polymorpha]|uniref:Uncharacterized protein n=1 Tax=Dreissena polymorpha TaxID=45954 RepID=A0A9D4J8Q7_DREPO|nr:hypothetical protein DPMN_156348 [Dreissena polymorpha]
MNFGNITVSVLSAKDVALFSVRNSGFLSKTGHKEPPTLALVCTDRQTDTYRDRHRGEKQSERDSRHCWNRILKAFANSLDPDETPQNVASHQDPNLEEKQVFFSETKTKRNMCIQYIKFMTRRINKCFIE